MNLLTWIKIQNHLRKQKKRIRNPAAWRKNQRAQLKNSGQEYISRTGKIIPAKEIKPPCSNKCKHKCSEHISEEQRYDIFKMYWDLSSLQRRRDFLNSIITVLQLAQRRLKTGVEKNRKPNTYYSLMSNGKSFRVCKLFLLNTLGISERTLRTVIEAKTNNESKGVAPIDKRGCHKNHSKTSSEVQESVRIHINSISRIESHYLRANTTREYIDGGLTIADLHRDYKRLRESENKEAATYDSYFRIFNTEFNISFFVPKKDQCDVCEQYKNAIGEEKEKLEADYT
ncbi:unnamed protein product [Parnassius apollo]|uniref:(apollo) hypothetical protein n=1 Tax=Parnassius apollo TaxID=110799 RepID=A0A8S3X4H6_PARAO|nr:unnamed protein product [Parnassius apollo]